MVTQLEQTNSIFHSNFSHWELPNSFKNSFFYPEDDITFLLFLATFNILALYSKYFVIILPEDSEFYQ